MERFQIAKACGHTEVEELDTDNYLIAHNLASLLLLARKTTCTLCCRKKRGANESKN